MQKMLKKKPNSEELPRTIDKLNDDCLIYIFQRLETIADRIRVERVCKRWQKLSKRSWNNLKKLDFRVDTWGWPNKDFSRIDYRLLDKVVKLSGFYLTTVNLSLGAFKRIYNFTPNIKVIHLYDTSDLIPEKCLDIPIRFPLFLFTLIDVFTPTNVCRIYNDLEAWSKEILPGLIRRFGNLEKFSFDFRYLRVRQDDLAKLFWSMKSLKSLHLSNCYFFGGNLTYTNLEELSLTRLRDTRNDTISSVIRKCNNLHTIYLSDLKLQGIEGIFEAVSCHAKSLKSFKLKGVKGEPNSVSEDSLTKICQYASGLICLKYLNLNYLSSVVNDKFLKVLATNCKQLEHLQISRCNLVTDEGIFSISNLQKLRFLEMQCLGVKHPPFEKFQNLEILDCAFCPLLEAGSLLTFLAKASDNLRALNLYGSVDLEKNRNVYRAVLSVVERRNSDLILELYYKFERPMRNPKPELLKILFRHKMRCRADDFPGKPEWRSKPQLFFTPCPTTYVIPLIM